MTVLPTTLLNQTTFLTHLLDTTRTGVAVLEPVFKEFHQIGDFRLTYANPVAIDLFGQAKADLTDGTVFYLQLFPTARVIGLFDALTTVMQTGQTYHNPELAYNWDGVNGWFDMQVSRFDGQLVMMFTEVTAIKHTQLDQQQQADFLQGLLQTSPSGIIVYEAVRRAGTDEAAQAGSRGEIVDFRSVFSNAAYAHIFGQPTEEIHRYSFRERFVDEAYRDLFGFYVRLVETGVPFRRERYYPHLDRWLDVSGTRWQDGFLVITDDVSERKEAESAQQYQAHELQRLNQELQRSNESLMEFSYVASHDLQEPLRKINQFSDILLRQFAPDLNEQAVDLVRRMQAASVRMSALIRDLLDYSRLSRQPETVRLQEPNQVVDGVLTALELVVAEKGAVVEVGPLGTLTGDATQLAQLFQNLLTNALKFARPDCPPHIQISSAPVARAGLPPGFQPSAGQESFCAIRVSDNGIGFEPGQAEQIFGAFQRLHGKGQYPGTGIGLAIARKVAENHGGYIMAQGQPDQGAVFTIYFPTAAPAAEG